MRDGESDGWKNASQSCEILSHPRLALRRALLIISILIVARTSVFAAPPSPSAESACGNRIGLRMVLDEGEIVIELDPAAAPDTIRTILALIEPQPQPEGETRGYYDGLTLSHTWPHIEVGTGVRPGESVAIPQEIDAASLGLDTEKITESSTAMNLWQFEFAEANERWKSEGSRPKQFEEWFRIFIETNSVDFLMEVSKKEINEVLGYRYVSDRRSLRARRGYVYLKPRSTVENSPALRILLTDRPQLDGRVTVVGRVVKGLELAQQLSVCELKTFRNRPIYEPVDPVVIRRMEPIELTEVISTSRSRDGAPRATDPNNQPHETVESEGGSR
jgi:cyclophilin family peptidyl-prolyl cis-trans isomerase